MINNDLVGYIKKYIQQGYTKEQIIDFLKQYNYNMQDVGDTVDFVKRSSTAEQKVQTGVEPEFPEQKQPTAKASSAGKKKIIIIAAVVVAILLVVTVSAYFFVTRPVCGNGVVEKGETADTCCEDTGCLGDQTCENSACVEPVCGACQYLQNHVCVDYGCCANEDCPTDKECLNNECVPVQCEFCQYAENHSCFDYECCSDADCLPGLECTNNVCAEQCGPCQYKVDGLCVDHECCFDDACSNDEKCENNACVPLLCSADKIAMNHSCVEMDGCASNDECDDGNSDTLDLCIGAGTPTAHCTHMGDADQCENDNDCDDDNITTNDVCSGVPKKCSNTLTDCDDIGKDCPPSYGTCNGTLHKVLDSDYCCIDVCTQGSDLSIYNIDDDDSIVEVEIEGADTVNSSESFKIYAFENRTRMDTTDGLQYVTLNGQNTTTKFYFNFTLWNYTSNESVVINVTAIVDYDDWINETNETNNNMTIQVTVS